MVVVHRNESKLGLGYENPDRTITVGVDRARVLVPKDFEYDLYNLDLMYDFGGVQLLSSTHVHRSPITSTRSRTSADPRPSTRARSKARTSATRARISSRRNCA